MRYCEPLAQTATLERPCAACDPYYCNCRTTLASVAFAACSELALWVIPRLDLPDIGGCAEGRELGFGHFTYARAESAGR